MSANILDTRVSHCENNDKLFVNQLDNFAHQIKEVANKIHETEKIMVKVCVLQESNSKDIDKLTHHLKNTDLAVGMLQDQQARSESQQEAKMNLFKTWQLWLTLIMCVLGIFGAAMSIYDRASQQSAIQQIAKQQQDKA